MFFVFGWLDKGEVFDLIILQVDFGEGNDFVICVFQSEIVFGQMMIIVQWYNFECLYDFIEVC